MNAKQDDGEGEKIAPVGVLRTSEALSFQAEGQLVPLPEITTAMRRFNRSTMFVAIGLLGTLIFAAVVLAVQEHHARPSELPDTIIQTTSGALPNGDPAALSGVVDLNSKNTDESSAGPVNNIQQEANRADPQANETSLSPARPNGSARVSRPKMSHLRQHASARPRFVDLKTRLLALWRQFWHESRTPKPGH